MLSRHLFVTLVICVAAMASPPAENEDLPEGNGKEIFVRMCSNCHALKRVTKVRFQRNFWESVVDDMVSRGAEGTEEEASVVVGYLTRNFGKPVKINEATAKEIQAGLSFTAADSALLVKHRTEHGAFKALEDLLCSIIGSDTSATHNLIRWRTGPCVT